MIFLVGILKIPMDFRGTARVGIQRVSKNLPTDASVSKFCRWRLPTPASTEKFLPTDCPSVNLPTSPVASIGIGTAAPPTAVFRRNADGRSIGKFPTMFADRFVCRQILNFFLIFFSVFYFLYFN